MLVRAEQHLGSPTLIVDQSGVAAVHGQRLQAAVQCGMATGPGRHRGGEQDQALVERQAETGVVTVHQDERTGL